MTFKQVAVFTAVARHLNFTKAARELHSSQPTISKHLKNLEESLKLELITRGATGVELTDAGHEFLKDVTPILEKLQRIDLQYRKIPTEKKPETLHVGGTYGPSSAILPSLLAAFKRKFPAVEVTLRSNSLTILEQLILQGELEIAVASGAPRSPEIASEIYVPLKLIAFAAKDYPPARKKQFTLADLAQMPLIVRGDKFRRGSTEMFLRELTRQGYRPKIAMVCESPEAIKSAVSKKLGVGFLYYDTVKRAIAGDSFKRLNIAGMKMAGQTYIVYHRQRTLSPAAEEFLKILRQWRDRRKTKKQPSTRASKRPPALTYAPGTRLF